MAKLIDLSNRTEKMRFTNKSETKAEIVIYGAIGDSWSDDGVSAKQFSDMLKEIPSSVKNIDLRINSPGGDCFQGIAIYNRLKQHPAKVTAYIDGLAASIASVLMLAADEIVMGESALVMIHLPWTFSMGNRKDMDATVERLMDIEEQMISLYAKRTKLSRGEIKSMLEKETWMDSTEAKDLGFIDTTMEETQPMAASILDKAMWINRVPKAVKTDRDVQNEKIKGLKTKVESFLARNKA